MLEGAHSDVEPTKSACALRILRVAESLLGDGL